MEDKNPPFKPDTVFHVYTHANAEENIFREDENYHFFLKRYAFYIYPIAKTYAYCLLPNHFHLAVKIRGESELRDYFASQDKDLIGFKNLSGLLSKQFSNFLNSYAKAFNKKYSRKGKLFLKSLNRIPVKNEIYYVRLINYVHQNPVHHDFVKHTSGWPFSSYNIFLSKKQTKLQRDEVLNWFGDKKSFVELHEQNREIKENEFY